MTSEIGRMFKCLKNKAAYHSLQDDAYSHITLIQNEIEDAHAHSNDVINADDTGGIPTNNADKTTYNKPKSCYNEKTLTLEKLNEEGESHSLRVESIQSLHEVTNNNPLDSIGTESGESNSNIIKPLTPTGNNTPTSESGGGGGGGGGGGIFSFFGLKFNKSSTRHLDRTASADSSTTAVEKSAAEACNRYTKFPLRGSKAVVGPEVSSTSTKGPSSVSSDPPSTSSKSSVESHSSSSHHSSSSFEISSSPSSSSSSAPQSNSKFDVSQIHLTPQTKVYSNPHRPVSSNSTSSSSSSRKRTFSPSTLLHICSFSKKSSSKSSHSSSSSSSFITRRKSKSDNNLHRVDLSGGVSSGHPILALSVERHGNILGDSLLSRSEDNTLRLNSVQIGDHATIHLPWTGLQRNNLSSNTPRRAHQNTHHNNLDGVRYVECGFKFNKVHNNSSGHVVSSPARSSSSSFNPQTSGSGNKVRSRSLERDAGRRIVPLPSRQSNSGSNSIAGTLNRKSSLSSDANNITHVLHSVRRCLTPEEQEILLRNISWDSSSQHQDNPPPRPAKPASLSRNQQQLFAPPEPPPKRVVSSSSSSSASSSGGGSRPVRRPPHIGAINRSSEPNSFSNSSDSSDSYCTPPSPPPRPLSSLKPDSRLIIPPKKGGSLLKAGCVGAGVVRSKSFKTPASTEPPVYHRVKRTSKSDTEDFLPESDRSSVHEERYECLAKATSHLPTVTVPLPRDSNSSSSSSSSSSAPKMSIEEAQNSGFIHKPVKGWLHNDSSLSKEGVTYTVRYIGCLDVNKSMKSLDFDTRSLIAKECINQVCEAAGLKSADRRRKIDRNVTRMLGNRPHLDNAGTDVHLTITSTHLKMTSLDTGAVIASHEMPNISFASGGDPTMLDFIAYVAKDPVVGRACFILECGSGLAQDVIVTIGQAFELRFKEYCKKRPVPPRLPAHEDADRDYYNDLPGKLPPEGSAENNSEKAPSSGEPQRINSKTKDIPSLTLPVGAEFSENLIDFEAPTPPAFGPSSQERHLESLLLLGSDSQLFPPSSTAVSNSSMGTGLGLLNSPSQPKTPTTKDPFDMQPFANDITKISSGVDQRKLLDTQSWFHGCISRGQAEGLLKNDGDFLVRESQTTIGQYVLTGQQNGCQRHLLLVDPEGVVRTKDQTFDDVIHLIRHHCDNCLPIISAESMVILRNPVNREPSK